MYCAFKCIGGLGNRLCNIMNMFAIHEYYPELPIYLIWLENNHCNIPFKELFSIQYDWILDGKSLKNNNTELWATTSIIERTRWDNIQEWAKHPYLVSVSFHLYSFVTYDFCRLKFNELQPSRKVLDNLQHKIDLYGINLPLIHFRSGDLLQLLRQNEENWQNSNVDITYIKALKDKYPNCIYAEYNIQNVDRSSDHMIDSLGDLLFFSKYCNVIAYCPYSWFSSWIFLLSDQYKYTKKIFNSRLSEIVFIENI